jgi:NAD(P)-dependent dehydrogenase (short-subunit alcohol dehydrogenase family)
MTGNGKLAGKRALVTGSGTGIGREIALEFAREGADVVLHYSRSKKGAQSAVDEIQAMGRRAEAFQADLSEVEACFDLVEKGIDFLGGLDILMNNAGTSQSCAFTEVTPDYFDFLYRLNIKGQFFCAQRAVKHMLEKGQKGVIINTTSSHAESSLPGFSVYAGTKGAIWSWTRQIAVELAPLGIRVNAICPGWTEVENYYKEIPNFDPIAIGKTIPYQRMGKTVDIAKACVYLASEDSDYMIGHVLVVDGGTMAKMALPDHSKEDKEHE